MDARYLCRGKRVDTGDWVQGNTLHSSLDEMFIVELFGDGRWFTAPREVCGSLLQVDPATVGHCTGLKDKNGKLIFEGDIFKDLRGRICAVEWDEENARFLGVRKVGSDRFIAYVGQEPSVEVIGTIHDDPELLGGETGGDEA